MTAFISGAIWSMATIVFYGAAKRLYAWQPRWWLAPLIVAPAGLVLVAAILHTSYGEYRQGTHWLSLLLGPATVAFAVPIYEQRAMIRRHWPVLLIGVIMGSVTAILSSWAMAMVLGMSDQVRLSLLPRSFSTPFAMTVSGDFGGIPEMTALFVIFTGVMGAVMGEVLLNWLPIRSVLARGALFGMGAHAVGVAKSHSRNREEGSIAGIVMIMVGLLNVLIAPVLAPLFS